MPLRRAKLTEWQLLAWDINRTDGQSVDLRLNDGELHALAELTVTAAKPTVKRELGSFRISPNSYVSLANNSYDLLGLMPLISRSPGGKYSIWGAGAATIYLNGRRPIMSQEQLKIYLQSVPAQNIKEIVIIQDSGASQRGPIINVILDKPDEGFLGNVSVWLWAGQDIFPAGNVMAYYAKDRIAFSAAVFGRVSNQTWESQTDVDFRESGELQNQYNKSRSVNNAVNTEFQLQYTINSKSYVGAFAHIRNIFNSSLIHPAMLRRFTLTSLTAAKMFTAPATRHPTASTICPHRSWPHTISTWINAARISRRQPM